MTREFIREEEDGSTTTTTAIEVGGVFKTLLFLRYKSK